MVMGEAKTAKERIVLVLAMHTARETKNVTVFVSVLLNQYTTINYASLST